MTADFRICHQIWQNGSTFDKMTEDLTKWQQIWTRSHKIWQNDSWFDNMTTELTKWQQIWQDPRFDMMTPDLARCQLIWRNGSSFDNITAELTRWQLIWQNDNRYDKMIPDLTRCQLIWQNGRRFEYQPSGTWGTCSPPATPHRLQTYPYVFWAFWATFA